MVMRELLKPSVYGAANDSWVEDERDVAPLEEVVHFLNEFSGSLLYFIVMEQKGRDALLASLDGSNL